MAIKSEISPDEYEVLDPAVQELFTQKGDQYELTGIVGMKTQADVDRLKHEAGKHRIAKREVEKELEQWKELGDLDEIQKNLDRIPELEAASKGNVDENELEEMANKRAEGVIASRVKPLERENRKLVDQLNEITQERDTLVKGKRNRTIRDAVGKQLIEMKVLPEYHEDAFMHAERLFEIEEETDRVITRDSVGVTPGLDPRAWLEDELLPKRPGWLTPSRGGGARGSSTAAAMGGSNPWTRENWNVTKQGEVVREKGAEHAEKLAKSAGSFVGSPNPPSPKQPHQS